MELGIKEKLKQFAEKKGLEKWFQRDNLIILILSGVLLLIIALPTGTDSGDSQDSGVPREDSRSDTADSTLSGGENGDLSLRDGGNGQSNDQTLSTYETGLEQRLKAILETMSGAGRVEVMITFSSSEELVVEKDRPIVRNNTTESDSEGGSRSIYQIDSGETTVYSSVDGDSEPYVVKTLTPKVEGVVVAAQGAGTGEVSKNITEAVQVLFDLDAHKVKVISLGGSGK